MVDVFTPKVPGRLLGDASGPAQVYQWLSRWTAFLPWLADQYAHHIHTDFDRDYANRVRRASALFRDAVPFVWTAQMWSTALEAALSMPQVVTPPTVPMPFDTMLFALTDTWWLMPDLGEDVAAEDYPEPTGEAYWVLFHRLSDDRGLEYFMFVRDSQDHDGDLSIRHAVWSQDATSDDIFTIWAGIFFFLQSPYVVSQSIPVAEMNRAERRRIDLMPNRPQHDPLFVRLRRLSRQGESDALRNGQAIEWSHQWAVSGHWRNQWYARDQLHRPVWVAPYIKGPADKPLLHVVRLVVR